MMKQGGIALATVMIAGAALALSAAAQQPEDKGKHEDAHAERDHGKVASKKMPFDRLKSLKGHWIGPDEDGDGKPDREIIYAVIAADSAVAETIFPGTPHEMITMYHRDGDDLLVTHYCAAGNQPRMKAKQPIEGDTIVFEFMDGTNMDPSKDLYMGALTVKFIDDDHFEQHWTSFENGEKNDTMVMGWTRVTEVKEEVATGGDH